MAKKVTIINVSFLSSTTSVQVCAFTNEDLPGGNVTSARWRIVTLDYRGYTNTLTYFTLTELTSVASDTCKDDPRDADRPGRAMDCGIQTSHSIGQMDIAIDVAVQAVDQAQVACSSQAPEQCRQHLHRYTILLHPLVGGVAQW